jgi:hypothetical protein
MRVITTGNEKKIVKSTKFGLGAVINPGMGSVLVLVLIDKGSTGNTSNAFVLFVRTKSIS